MLYQPCLCQRNMEHEKYTQIIQQSIKSSLSINFLFQGLMLFKYALSIQSKFTSVCFRIFHRSDTVNAIRRVSTVYSLPLLSILSHTPSTSQSTSPSPSPPLHLPSPPPPNVCSMIEQKLDIVTPTLPLIAVRSPMYTTRAY